MSHATQRRTPRRLLLAAALACMGAAAVAHRSADADFDLDAALDEARDATRTFRNLSAAQAAGYTVLVQDQAGKTCIDQVGAGRRGIHRRPAHLGRTASAAAAAVRPFHLTRDGNRYGLPAFYQLHVWLWKRNPNGLFNDWNPTVRCP